MKNAEFCAHVVDLLAPLGRVTYRSMFGGWGFYLDGRIFAIADEDVLYFKADDANRGLYEAAGSEPFRPYPDRDTAMGYYEVPADLFDDADTLLAWARSALGVAERAAAKKAKKSEPVARRGAAKPGRSR